MIATVTFNPSLDYTVTLDALNAGTINRTRTERITPGGKGINVSLVLSRLGVETTAFGFLAGFTGDEIERQLRKSGCHTDFIRLPEGISRINMKIKAKEESEINGQGPHIPKEAQEQLSRKLEGLKEGDMLVLAGSVPAGIPETIYRDIAKQMQAKKVLVTVDAEDRLLLSVLECHPFLIKPNHHELAKATGSPCGSTEAVIRGARKLQELGAQHVLVSRAEKGAVLITSSGEVYESMAPKGRAINSVGAGDSMVAGFLAGYLESSSFEYALQLGIAAGSASAFCEGLAAGEDIKAICQRMGSAAVKKFID